MFKKTKRLNRAVFTEFFKAGRRFQSPSLTLVYVPTVPFKTAVVVGKKVSKLAVARNRTRRRLYAATARFTDQNSITTGVCILIAKPGAAVATRAALAIETADLLALAYQQKSR
jgi:ribonuclease P protein component